jgi:chromosomal replication initiation ATPase DnaA
LKNAVKENKELNVKVEKFAQAAGEAAQLQQKKDFLHQQLKEAMVELDILGEKYKKEQKIRKGLLNELEDIKGKIRVYCRIRPLSKTEMADEDRNVIVTHINDEFSLTVGNVKNRTKDYNFDTVFGPDSSQEAVFEDSKRLIQSAVDGFNVCIFAYGQTGSGKTWTVQGSNE